MEQKVTINFDNNEVKYEFSELTLLYATTIHKSQGSKYPVIVIPITMQHYLMLKKNLPHTTTVRKNNLLYL